MVGGAGGGAGTSAATSAGMGAGAGGGALGAPRTKRRTPSLDKGGASFIDTTRFRPALLGGYLTFSRCSSTVTAHGLPATKARPSLFRAVL